MQNINGSHRVDVLLQANSTWIFLSRWDPSESAFTITICCGVCFCVCLFHVVFVLFSKFKDVECTPKTSEIWMGNSSPSGQLGKSAKMFSCSNCDRFHPRLTNTIHYVHVQCQFWWVIMICADLLLSRLVVIWWIGMDFKKIRLMKDRFIVFQSFVFEGIMLENDL